jgi:hypothetical protein
MYAMENCSILKQVTSCTGAQMFTTGKELPQHIEHLCTGQSILIQLEV